ncbi:MAG TPA: hypothetical protein VJL83_02220 [Patescibacteria group bacterium]|nr:hypothetical protein [Patescibacteria group bacterium]
MSTRSDEAIRAALHGDWHRAVELNKEILAEKQDDVDALNRLAYAYTKQSNFEVAHDTYLAVLSIDTYNPIAKKNLGKIKQLASRPKSTYHSPSNNHHIAVSPSFFLADAQKTKSVHLIHVAAGDILQSLCVGEQLHAIKRGFELQIKDTASRYIGTLPDDIGHTLMRLLDQRSACEFYVKDIQDNEIMVFIKYC